MCEQEGSNRNVNSVLLQPGGDFYVTGHSNLAQVHLIFYFVAADSLKDANKNNRHPLVPGLRNIVKNAFWNNGKLIRFYCIVCHI